MKSKPDQEPQTQKADTKGPVAGSNKDDYLGLGEEIDPNKLLRYVSAFISNIFYDSSTLAVYL